MSWGHTCNPFGGMARKETYSFSLKHFVSKRFSFISGQWHAIQAIFQSVDGDSENLLTPETRKRKCDKNDDALSCYICLHQTLVLLCG